MGLIYRQSHQSFFEKSDLFFVCMLRPLSFDIHKQDLEIEAAQVTSKKWGETPFSFNDTYTNGTKILSRARRLQVGATLQKYNNVHLVGPTPITGSAMTE